MGCLQKRKLTKVPGPRARWERPRSAIVASLAYQQSSDDKRVNATFRNLPDDRRLRIMLAQSRQQAASSLGSNSN